ncbi:hypothetical protein [Microcoleus sp.]|uniref:hypothetical protein n=1 Tax=Microcoleus sp. TaxID=44472 RepID=UPI0035946E1B
MSSYLTLGFAGDRTWHLRINKPSLLSIISCRTLNLKSRRQRFVQPGGGRSEWEMPIARSILSTTPTPIPSSSETSPTAGTKVLGRSLPSSGDGKNSEG